MEMQRNFARDTEDDAKVAMESRAEKRGENKKFATVHEGEHDESCPPQEKWEEKQLLERRRERGKHSRHCSDSKRNEEVQKNPDFYVANEEFFFLDIKFKPGHLGLRRRSCLKGAWV